MKTSVIMERPMGNYKIHQRTKDGYFDANSLLAQWNKNNKRRRLDDFLKSKSTQEFTEVLNEEIAQGEKSPMAYYIKKGRNTSKGKTKDQVWMHPYLFID
ncbi:MAG: KilA-N domain-containing protein, partial [Gelidibacter sp.]|nr:KilA-N domain-containing protein [Gelidibacter sp.]